MNRFSSPVEGLDVAAPGGRRRRRGWRTFTLPVGLWLFAGSLAMSSATLCIAATSASTENLVKAAFLYNFAKFVDWPDESFDGDEVPFTLCLLGEDPISPALKSIAGKTVRGRTLSVKNLDELSEAATCHVVFVSQSEQHRLAELVPYFQERHILTVSDMLDFARLGGVIGLVKVSNKIRFEVNLGAARRAGLTISSNLLRLAREVHEINS